MMKTMIHIGSNADTIPHPNVSGTRKLAKLDKK